MQSEREGTRMSEAGVTSLYTENRGWLDII